MIRFRFFILLLLTTPVLAQDAEEAKKAEPAPEERPEAADSDPVRVVLLNVRNEYYDLKGGNWMNSVILRSDRALLRKTKFGGKLGILTRLDLPINTAEVASSVHAGLGDLYAQAVVFPFLTARFALFAGTGMVFPTATHDTLGAGKWTVAPATGPVFFFGGMKGLAFVKIQEYISFAGESGRPDLNYLLVTPTVIWRFIPGWWTQILEESRIDFNNHGSTWYKVGVQLGHMFTKKVGLWVQPEILWGGSRPGDYDVKCSFVWNH